LRNFRFEAIERLHRLCGRFGLACRTRERPMICGTGRRSVGPNPPLVTPSLAPKDDDNAFWLRVAEDWLRLPRLVEGRT
jgi:hypothetical protein